MKTMRNVVKKSVILFFCILALFFTRNLNAQEEESGGFSLSMGNIEYGAKGGAVFHNFTNQPKHMGGKLGFSAGIYGAYPITDMIAVQLDLAYFQQGGTYIQFMDNTRFGVPESFVSKNVKDASVTLHNLYIPLQAKLNLFSQSYIPKILLGPYLDVNIAATERYERTGEIEPMIYGTATGNDVVTDQYERYQFGLTGGLEFDIPSDSGWGLIFSVHYKYGITAAKKSYSYIDYFTVKEDFKTNALSITLGVKF